MRRCLELLRERKRFFSGVLKGLEEERVLSEEEKLRKDTIINDLGRTTLLEEVSWRQKSRVLWLREGGECTKFFYRVANSNRRNNSIEQLVVNGTVYLD
jgi:hypothetical protein